MSKLRIETPLKKRYGINHAAKRAAKREDRASFRQHSLASFRQLGGGLQVMDRAIVGVYEQFSTFKWLQYAVDIAVIAAVLFLSKTVQPVYILVAAGLSYIPLAYGVYKQVKRARDAREEALYAALEAQKRAGVAPPPQQPVVQPAVAGEAEGGK